jgi:hypothetical protein
MKGQRGMVTGWTGSTGTLVLAAIDFACRRFSACFGLLASVNEVRLFENALPVSGNPNTAHDRHSLYRNIRNSVYEQSSPGTRPIPRAEFRNFCRVLTASSPTGGVPFGAFPPDSPSGGRAVPRVPLPKPPTTSSANLLTFYIGADTICTRAGNWLKLGRYAPTNRAEMRRSAHAREG